MPFETFVSTTLRIQKLAKAKKKEITWKNNLAPRVVALCASKQLTNINNSIPGIQTYTVNAKCRIFCKRSEVDQKLEKNPLMYQTAGVWPSNEQDMIGKLNNQISRTRLQGKLGVVSKCGRVLQGAETSMCV